ncbi:MAG TPA: ribosomal protein S18-alanine N-acetyltransferase [Polyangiaceae bacterium]|nr:ribosomal protein S18-alanine N-acetyltransferase [Polyangiaceae bacterium]
MSEPAAAPSIARLERADFPVVSEILRASGLDVDLEAELGREFALPWVLKSSGAPVAFSLAWSVADELQLLDMASHPAHRRRGYGRALLIELLRYAQREHKRLLLLEVRQSNEPAIRLYRSIGFDTTGVRRGYYSDTGEDALEMRITFDPSTGQIVPESSR